jgi:hypothetical protein
VETALSLPSNLPVVSASQNPTSHD